MWSNDPKQLAAKLRKAADEMRAEDKNGWPVLCDTVADYLEANPSPSPAPGVVEALKQAIDRFEEIRLLLVHHLHEPERSAFWKAVDGRTKCQTALASLSQPAEKEERPVSYHDWLLSTSLSQPAKEREGGGL